MTWTTTARRFFATPKGLLTIVLALFCMVAVPGQGFRLVAPGLAASVAAAGALDAAILRWRRKSWWFPSGAVLTALIVVMVLSAREPWYVAATTSVVGVLSKYILRTRGANVFNPAALGIVATFHVFDTGQSWWGALPDVAPAAQLLLLAGGLFIADRVNRMPLVLSFLGVYYSLFAAAAFVGNPRWVAEVFRTPDLQAALFFALIILTDPPTSPVRDRDQIIYGALVAAVSFAVFEWVGAVYYLLAGVLVGNVWEAWRRVARRAGFRFPNGIGPFLREIAR